MKFEYNKELSVTARKRLIKGLTQVAELYFNSDYQPCSVDPKKVNIGCGICKAMNDLGYKYSYTDMMHLFDETDELSYGRYSYTAKEWEPRANMCLFLVEYLKDTIKEKA
jgi:hypothetical protein